MAKKKEDDIVDICCACRKELDNVEHFYVNFRYQVPTMGMPEKVMIATICDVCAKESDDPSKFPAIEAMILTLLIRINHPDKMFTPDKRADE